MRDLEVESLMAQGRGLQVQVDMYRTKLTTAIITLASVMQTIDSAFGSAEEILLDILEKLDAKHLYSGDQRRDMVQMMAKMQEGVFHA